MTAKRTARGRAAKTTRPGKLRTERWPIESLRADPRNARHHPDRNVEQVVTSLERFGQVRPILIQPDGTVIAGSGTLAAATQLGLDALDVIVWPGPPDADAMRAYGIVDNRTAELATWDAVELAGTIAQLEGTPYADVGFKPAELAYIGRDAEAPTEFKREDSDAHLQYRCPSCGHTWGGSPS